MTDLIKPIYPGMKVPIDPNNPNYYLDKKQLHAALKQYKTDCLEAESKGIPAPKVPEYVGACFLDIARGLAQKHNFRSYSYINDMISDALMSCIKYVRTYDPDRLGSDGKPTSPLSYFTQTCNNAFIDRIKKEKKVTRIKRAMIMSANIETSSYDNDDDASEFKTNLNDFIMSLGTEDTELDEKIRELNRLEEERINKPGPLDILWADDPNEPESDEDTEE